ncbi:hypothetical protein [Sphingomonas sp. HMP6]|uniref:hypothetical protein n=1 Tax=Sphingomonas sp. HMP6 TaxID=1517551 RepID=UPI0015970D65|nr:hypothetical protein [Sphingomonas sp. HMP6]BCA59475.1 hypothetical protein HMP06_2244 [Sphingomonas sp. HMP6]
MNDPAPPPCDGDLVGTLDRLIADAGAARQSAFYTIAALYAEQAALGHHPHYPAYITGGMLLGHGFGAGHILAVLGVHTLDWREVLAPLADAALEADDNADLLLRLRALCEADPMLEIAGEVLADELDLLKHGRIDPFWLRRPKFGLGQAALAFGLKPHHAEGHRGLYALPLEVLRRGFENAAPNQHDQRFGAMLVPVIETGGERLARIGAAAQYRNAETRYHDDSARFAAHQRAHPDRRWRWKPPLSRQGHLAVTTAQTLDIDVPAARTRGHAANWLGDHHANLRFTVKES